MGLSNNCKQTVVELVETTKNNDDGHFDRLNDRRLNDRPTAPIRVTEPRNATKQIKFAPEKRIKVGLKSCRK